MTFLTQTYLKHRPEASCRASLNILLSVRRQRRALAKLDARALEDMGITVEEARAESRRSFWDFAGKHC